MRNQKAKIPDVTKIKNMVNVSVSLLEYTPDLRLNPLDYKFELFRTEIRKIANENDFYYVNHYAVSFDLEKPIEKRAEELAKDLLTVKGIMDFTIMF